MWTLTLSSGNVAQEYFVAAGGLHLRWTVSFCFLHTSLGCPSSFLKTQTGKWLVWCEDSLTGLDLSLAVIRGTTRNIVWGPVMPPHWVQGRGGPPINILPWVLWIVVQALTAVSHFMMHKGTDSLCRLHATWVPQPLVGWVWSQTSPQTAWIFPIPCS